MMHTLTFLGSTAGFTIQVLLLTILLAWRRPQGWHWELAIILLALGGGVLFNYLLKTNYQRLRPTIYPSAYVLTSYSFPSGHAMVSTCFYGAIMWVLAIRLREPWLKALLLFLGTLLIAGIGLSRIYFAVHYPTDIIGGILAGVAWLILAISTLRVWQRLRLRRQLAKLPQPGIQ